MISRFNQFIKLQEELSIDKFNSSLPITIEILEKISPNRYLVRFGNRKISTKSLKELKVNTKYWAEFKTVKNSINISSLIEQPFFLQHQFDSFVLNAKKLKELLNIKNFDKELKTELLNQLHNVTNRDEFEFISILFISLVNNTITLPLLFDKKLEMFQIKKNSQNSYEFYFGLKNIGPVRGNMIKDKLFIKCAYQTSLLFLTDRLNMLKPAISISLHNNIQPIFDISHLGLNIKI